MILFLPFGISSGYVIVTLAWLLFAESLSAIQAAGGALVIVAAAMLARK